MLLTLKDNKSEHHSQKGGVTTMERNEVAELLKSMRLRAGMTQQQVADRIYLDRTTVVKIESGDIKAPSYVIVKEWARITESLDLLTIHSTGNRDSWKKHLELESKFNKIKELVNFMKRRKVNANS